MIKIENQSVRALEDKLHGIGSDLTKWISMDNPSLLPKEIEYQNEGSKCR